MLLSYARICQPNLAILFTYLSRIRWKCLFLFLSPILIEGFLKNVAFAQNLTPQLRQPQPFPEISPSPIPEAPLSFPESPNSPESPPVAGTLTVTQFVFENNTVFSTQELEQILIPFLENTIGNIQDEKLSFSQLIEISSLVADYYSLRGYRTSGAVIVIPEATQKNQQGVVTIQVIEGRLSEIQVGVGENLARGKLNNYIRSRLRVNPDTPLNIDQLLEGLKLLQLDPLISSISAQISVGVEPGESILKVSYTPVYPLSISILLDNGGLPSSGTFQRGIGLRQANLLGLGDGIELSYVNTDGSNSINFNYEIPFNSRNGTLRFDYNYSKNQVIEPPFDDIDGDGNSPDITSNYNAYDFTIKQPIIRSIDEQTFREFSLSLTASWRNTQSFLFGKPFPLALSADVLGNTRVFALRLSQDFIEQNSQEILALHSQFSFGFDAFGSTINEVISGLEPVPDSRFFSWQFQGQYVRLIAPNTSLVVRSNLQLADRPLLPIEQFATGGLGSVLGYRQNQLLTDNGLFLATEIRLPILQLVNQKNQNEVLLQMVPFLNYGMGWNTDTISPYPNNLASVGLGLLLQLGDFNARVDYGIPLVSVPGDKNTWQENGIYFTIQYGSF